MTTDLEKKISYVCGVIDRTQENICEIFSMYFAEKKADVKHPYQLDWGVDTASLGLVTHMYNDEYNMPVVINDKSEAEYLSSIAMADMVKLFIEIFYL